jgi:hypothetical protein
MAVHHGWNAGYGGVGGVAGFCSQPQQPWATGLGQRNPKGPIATEDCISDERGNARATRGGRTPVVAPAVGSKNVICRHLTWDLHQALAWHSA